MVNSKARRLKKDMIAISGMKEIQNRIRSLWRIPGQKTTIVGLSQEAIRIVCEKIVFAETIARIGRFRINRIAEVLRFLERI